jgi:metal-sulfur cluster biosynthetic enzyme
MTEDSKPKSPHWDIEDSHPQMFETIRQSLRAVKDPEIGLDIIQLGLVRNVSMTDDSILVRMMLTTPYCPYGPSLLEAARAAVERAADNKPTRIDFSLEPWDFSYMEDGAIPDWGIY